MGDSQGFHVKHLDVGRERRHLFRGHHALERHPHTPGCQVPARQAHGIRQAGEGPARDHIGRRDRQRLDPTVHRLECTQTQFGSHLADETGLLGHGIHTRNADVGGALGARTARRAGTPVLGQDLQGLRQGDRQRDTGQAGA